MGYCNIKPWFMFVFCFFPCFFIVYILFAHAYTPGRLMDGNSAKQQCFDESSEVHEGAARCWKNGILGQ